MASKVGENIPKEVALREGEDNSTALSVLATPGNVNPEEIHLVKHTVGPVVGVANNITSSGTSLALVAEIAVIGLAAAALAAIFFERRRRAS